MTTGRAGTVARRPDAVLLVIALAIAGGYLVLGVGRVMDDWYALRQAHFDGSWRAAGSDQMSARPVAGVVYALVFGLLGRAVVPTVLMMAIANAGSAMLLRRLSGLVAPPAVATAAAICWLVVPTRTSLEAWSSAANISLALVSGLGALWLAARGPRSVGSLVAGSLLAAVSVLAYEVTIVLIVPIALALIVLDGERRLRTCVGVVSAAVVSSGWIVLHWHPNKRITSAWGDVGQVIPANFTWGIAPRPLSYAVGFLVLVVTVPVLAGVLPGARWTRARAPMAAGWAVLLLGVVPFLKYTYAPVGAGDRANTISSLGGALVLATVIWVLVGPSGRRVLVGVGVLAGIALQPRVLMMRSWALSGDDADRIVAAVQDRARPGDDVVLGPVLIDRNGVTAMQHPDIFEDAVQLALDSIDTAGTVSSSLEEFERTPGVHVDLREIIPDPDAPGDR